MNPIISEAMLYDLTIALDGKIKLLHIFPDQTFETFAEAARDVPRARVHELLVEAREQLLKRGWATNWITTQGRVCIMGAVALARFPSEMRACTPQTYIRLAGALRAAALSPEGWACAIALLPSDPQSVFRWNDNSTQQAVMTQLEEAIEATAPEVEVVEVIEERELALV